MRHIKIKPREDQKVWFTSDTHYGHSNIVKGCTKWKDDSMCRDYTSIKEHNQDLVKRINETVQWNDILFHLGDWSFGGIENITKFRDQIHCENIHLVLGNHDKHIENDIDGIGTIFRSVSDRIHLQYDIHDFILDHYPQESWMGILKGWFHLFGHQHTNRIGSGRKMDIGIDKYGRLESPYRIEEVIELLSKLPIRGGRGDSSIEIN